MKPILFSGPMVRAILDGRKTQTRREIKTPGGNVLGVYLPDLGYALGGKIFENLTNEDDPICVMTPVGIVRPRYLPGDILWVRETWRLQNYGYDPSTQTYKGQELQYRADFTDEENAIYGRRGGCAPCKWKPSIHMPREAARIFLRVTKVKVERLQAISESDAQAEGCGYGFHNDGVNKYIQNHTPKEQFAAIWNSLHSKKGCGWEADPCVWVYEFERVENE